jgi:mannose-6-phosphate isomerase class I
MDGSQNADCTLRKYLYKQRKSLLRIKIWLLEQHQEVTARTYVTATNLHGDELKAACLEHQVEAFELLRMMREHMPIIPTQKSFTGVFMLSGKAFLALQFNQFVFSSDRV